MMNVDLEKTKFFGLYAVWPLNHLLGMSKLEKPTPETPKKLKPGYTVRAYHSNFKEWFEGLIRVVPFFAITLLADYFYPIGDQMQESKAAI